MTKRFVAALALFALTSVAAAEMRPFAPDSLKQIVASHAGRPLVVAFWSTTCVPCREELAHWGAWKRRHAGVDVLLVNVDGTAEQDAAAHVLAGYALRGVETWAFADDYAERLRWSVDPAWRGEVPRTHLYDASGRLTVLTGKAGPGLHRWVAGTRAGRRP